MKLIIDISEEQYELVRHGNKSYTTELELMTAVANGTSLPKGHGRLVDADAMQKYQIDTFGKRLLVIDTAPTIIEADKEG